MFVTFIYDIGMAQAGNSHKSQRLLWFSCLIHPAFRSNPLHGNVSIVLLPLPALPCRYLPLRQHFRPGRYAVSIIDHWSCSELTCEILIYWLRALHCSFHWLWVPLWVCLTASHMEHLGCWPFICNRLPGLIPSDCYWVEWWIMVFWPWVPTSTYARMQMLCCVICYMG